MHVAALLQEQLRLLRQAGPAQPGGAALTRAQGPAERRRSRFDEGHAPDALELLNGLRPLELRALAQRLQVTAELAAASGVGELRRALWRALAAATGGGDEEPDWRGDVEIKTVPVARTRDGLWRVVEDPAISTVGATPIAKLQRVLWLCRAEVPPDDATLLSWYLLEWDPVVATLVERYLHTRPKGPRGGRGRGYYLHKRFFAEAGLWASLNGPPVVETR